MERVPDSSGEFTSNVFVNVYDLHESNRQLSRVGVGFYHSGVEVHGFEYSFSSVGITKTKPRMPEYGPLKEQVHVGVYQGSPMDVYNIIQRLKETFGEGKYDPIKNNCNYFSEVLVRELINEDIPEWINRAARVASRFTPTQSSSTPTANIAPLPEIKRGSSNVSATQRGRQTFLGNLSNWFFKGNSSLEEPRSRAASEDSSSRRISTTSSPGSSSSKKELTAKQRELLENLKNGGAK